MTPVAKRLNIHIERLPGELALYDKSSHRVHCLNMTVATVWLNADGKNTVEDLAQLVAKEVGIEANPDVVLLALAELRDANLLDAESPMAATPEAPPREVSRRTAIAAGVSVSLLPAVASILAPTAAMARSQYTAATWQADYNKANTELTQQGLKYLTNNTATQDMANALAQGIQGNTWSALGNNAKAQTFYQASASDINDALKQLGLPGI